MYICSFEEFNQSIDLSNFNVVCGGVFVIWNWAWVGDDVDSDNDTSESSRESSARVVLETPNESLDERELEPESLLANVSCKPLTIHTVVTFKCIGCTEEEYYRKALSKATKLMNCEELSLHFRLAPKTSPANPPTIE